MNLLITLKNKIFFKKEFFFIFIFIISLVSRSIVAYFYGDKNLENEWAILINNLYLYNSFSLLRFDDLFVPNLWMPPIYGYFIYLHVLFFELGSKLVPSVLITQIIISSITPIIFYKILANFFDNTLAIIGALTFSLFPLIVYSAGQISSVTIYLFLLVYFIKLVLDLSTNQSIKKIIILSIIAGILILTRRDFLLIYIISLIYMTIFFKINYKNIFLMIIISILTISPYLIRNYLAFDKIIVHSGLGYNVWKAYNPKAKVEGYYVETTELKAKLNTVKKDIFYRINEDKFYFDEAKKYISEDPSKYLGLYIKRLFSFYFYDLDSSQKNYYNIFHIYPILFLSLVSLVGFFTYQKQNMKLNYVILIMFIILFVYSSFAILPRYKIYLLPFQIILGLRCVELLIKKLRVKN